MSNFPYQYLIDSKGSQIPKLFFLHVSSKDHKIIEDAPVYNECIRNSKTDLYNVSTS